MVTVISKEEMNENMSDMITTSFNLLDLNNNTLEKEETRHEKVFENSFLNEIDLELYEDLELDTDLIKVIRPPEYFGNSSLDNSRSPTDKSDESANETDLIYIVRVKICLYVGEWFCRSTVMGKVFGEM